jgi:hypothetical protein
MAEVPVLVTNWKKVVRTVVASIRANADLVAPKIQRDLYPEDPEGTQVRTGYLARADALERKVQTLDLRAQAVLAERGDDTALANEHEAAKQALRQRIIRTRSFGEGAFDAAVMAQLGLTGETPRDPDALLTYGAHAAKQLRAVPLPAIDEEEEGASFKAERHATLIESGVARLHAATQALADDARDEQKALKARNEAEEDLRTAYIAAAAVFAGDAVAAGHRDIADRVRPTARRRDGLPEDVDLQDNTGDPDPVLVDGEG